MPQNKYYDIEIEQEILVYVLHNKQDYEKVFEFITNDFNYFYDDKLRQLYEYMFSLFQNGTDINYHTIKDKIENDTEKIVLKQLKNKKPDTLDIDSVLEILEEKRLARDMKKAIDHSYKTLEHPKHNINDKIEKVQQMIFDVNKKESEIIDKKHLLMDISDDLDRAMEQGIDTNKYILSHYNDLDTITGGFEKGDLVIIAARPSIGKTAFAVNLADRFIEHSNKSVLFYSLEMSATKVMQRFVSLKSKTSYDDRKRGRNYLTKQEYKRAMNSISDLYEEDYTLYISEESGLKPASVRAKTRRQIKRNNIDIVIIDFLQLMNGNHFGSSEYQKITNIVRDLQDIAKELGIILIVLSQLSRKVETRNEKIPILSDSRDSGAIEEAADAILMLYRESYYKFNSTDTTFDVYVRKNRDGKTGHCKLTYDKNYNLIKSRER